MQTKQVRIGITTRVMQTTKHNEFRDCLAHDWSRFLMTALPNAAWLLLPNLGEKHIVDYCERWGINRLILTGGDDIGTFNIRDETELKLLNWANTTRIQVLGICRGMQLMGLNAGATLKSVDAHVCTQHNLSGKIAGKANSFHNYALSSCPAGFEVTAYSEDGEIEAIRHASLPWEGWMWHPEREATIQERDIKNLEILFR